jgi:N-acetylated-alpha-linked acidic dipeptidase
MMQKSLTFLLCLWLGPWAFGQSIHGFSPQAAQQQAELEKKFLGQTDFGRFRTHLEAMTQEPHVAGSPANERVRDYLAKTMTEAGWQSEVFPYDLYLPTGPGTSLVELVLPTRRPLNQQEDILAQDLYSAHAGLGKGWNAWSGSGDVTAEVVYANYGRREDFERLKALGVDVKGKIVLARYGGNFRGYKAKFAEAAGAAGVIIYTDPADAGYAKGLTYPEGPYFSPSSIQRGSLLTMDFTGDPLTPFQPALPRDGKVKVPRLDPAKASFHTIPVTPIGYGEAQQVLQQMAGRVVPLGWQGGLPFTYRLEGGPGLKVRLKVEQQKDFVRASNVVGTLVGSEHPDEWVILGCHYDAWAFGSTDPNSGSAMMLALAETLGKMAKSGIRPKRTIKLAHWDAEEHGVIGSTEWVEQMRTELGAKAVAYINLDAAVSGRSFSAASAPSLKQLIVETTKLVNFPDSAKTVYQTWASGPAEPTIANLGGGSDHIGFYMHVGVPSMSVGMGGPTLYHTNYDDLHFYQKFADPSFKMGGVVEQLVGLMSLRLANADLVPYQLGRYATDLRAHFRQAEAAIGLYAKPEQFAGFKKASAAIDALAQASETAEKKLAAVLAGSLAKAEQAKLNQQLLALEKNFIDEKGMYFGAWYRSLYAANDPYSGYGAWVLPGIQYEIENKATQRLAEWDERYAAAIGRLAQQMQQLGGAAK